MANDDRMMRWTVLGGAALCLLAMGYTIFQDPVFASLGAQAERRRYFEQTIRGKGLDLHPAHYWKESGR